MNQTNKNRISIRDWLFKQQTFLDSSSLRKCGSFDQFSKKNTEQWQLFFPPIFSPFSSNFNKKEQILDPFEEIEKILEESQTDMQGKLYVVAQTCVNFNEFVFKRILEITEEINENINGWELSRTNWWFEKTPLYWYQYFKTPKNQRIRPELEIEKKIQILEKTQKRLFEFLGTGNRVSNKFKLLKENPQASLLLHLLKQNQVLLVNQMDISENPSLYENSNQEFLSRIFTEEEKKLFQKTSEISEKNLFEVVNLLKNNFKSIEEFESYVQKILQENKRPNHFSANWLRYCLIILSSLILWRYLSGSWQSITTSIEDTKITLVNFIRRYVLIPLKDIYQTIRYDKSSFQLLDPKSIVNDVDSLSRMVENYLKQERPDLNQNQINDIVEKIKQGGDIESLMPTYEKQIQKPLKNVVFGNLVENLLIQVQKLRVDGDRAMAALDKLLRSNELNFQALALIPVVSIVLIGFRFVIGGIWAVRPTNKIVFRNIRNELRKVERILDNLTVTKFGVENQMYEIPLEVSGRLTLSFNRLEKLSLNLPSKFQEQFLEDISDLESEDYSISQKKATIIRMYHTFPFLQPNF